MSKKERKKFIGRPSLLKRTGKTLPKLIFGAIILTIGGPALLANAITPSLMKRESLGRKISKLGGDIPRYRVNQGLKRLEKRKLIKIIEKTPEGEIIKLTCGGKKYLNKYYLEHLSIQKPKKWDGLWRIVIFDIPVGKDRERNALRSTLRRIGFYALQKSVFACPYSCEKEIRFISRFFDIERYVNLLVAQSLGNAESRARHHFNF